MKLNIDYVNDLTPEISLGMAKKTKEKRRTPSQSLSFLWHPLETMGRDNVS